MGKSLVIVESPAKAKTINKYLGSEFIVKSSVGHIRDLPKGARTVDPLARSRAAAITRSMSAEEKITHKIKKAREKLFISMGVNPEKDWQAQYEILPGKEKVVAELKKLAKNADTIYLATDLDREGEAIAWHLREIIGGNEDRYKRVVFNEITKKAIQEAFSKPTELDMDRVNAQQARRFLDRVVGYMVSPLLWRKVARSLSAGRVQSVAVKLVVEREREIKAFDPDEYWTLHADLESESGEKIRFEIKNFSGENFLPKNKEQTYLALETLNAASYSIIKREDKPTGSKPSAPFITSTLQQAASTRLGYGVKKTMVMAQRLYQAGYITYMRTDSANLSVDAVAACRNYIEQHFGKKYLPKKPNIYSSKSDAQEAHEAIRPSNVDITPDDLIDMDDARQLYQLIWQQFLACQMMPAEFTSTTVKVEAAGYELKAKGRVMRFDGYLKALPLLRKKDDDDDELPDLCVGDIMKLNVLLPLQHFTKSPPRFSEAALVKELEKLGIGRPSTYAAIISKIQDAGYVRVDNRRFYAEKIGDIVTVRLNESFSDLMNYGFTAAMEVHLDDVASGKRNWKDVLNRFYVNFSASLSRAESEEGGMRLNEPTLTDLECPRQDCLRLMTIRTGATGVFLSCAGYTLPPKEQCKSTLNLSSGDEAVNVDDDEAESRQLIHKHRCGICDTAMDSYLVDTTRKLHICGKNPSCPGFEVEKGAFVLKGYEGPSLSCDKCGVDMHLKDGRFGKYFGCTAKDCKNTRKLLRSGEAAPPKMDPVSMPDLLCVKVEDHYILRDGAVGMFLAASQYPKYRETRAPLVVELIPYKDAINSKYEYLFSAPQKDSDGLQALVRFDRKNKEHYVQTELGGKPTGWRARYTDGHWKIEDDRKTAKK